ncbi:MAG: radical SAM protein [Ruminococcus sp.]|nr:radical SAM protein [Ruminococcus sp.]
MLTIPCKTILQKNKTSEWFGNDYNMNLYRGCCHGCIYCDSRSECYHVDNFDTVKAKENALAILRDELRRKIRKGIIGTGAMSDPYNPFEQTELLTRHALELISAYEFGITVITKSPLITRDIDVYNEISEHSPILCKMTVTTADDELCRLIEPNAAPSSERFNALAKMSESGLFTGITLMPVLPFLEDSENNIVKIVRTAHQCGVRCIYPFFGVTLRANQREHFLDELDKRFPDSKLRERYIRYFGNRYECISPNAKRLWSVFTSECDRFGILYNMKSIISAYQRGYGDMQLSFF